MWLSQDIGNETYFIKQVKQRLKDCSFQMWHNDINTSSRCDLYKKYLTGATFIRFPEKENRKIPRAF